MAKKEDEFELVPERKFELMEKKLAEIFKSPIVKSKDTKELSENVKSVNASLTSLYSVLHKISENTSFEETENKLIQNQLKPLVRVIKNIREQNETIANGMVNIIDRLNDMQNDLIEIKNTIYPRPSTIENTSLPPLSGGPIPPTNSLNSVETSSQNNISEATTNVPPPVSSTLPPPIGAKPLGGIPPLQQGGLKKKGFFK